jgi:hypothetical protein
MLRTVAFLIAGVIFAAFCRTPVRSEPPVDEKTIVDEIQESKSRKPFYINNADIPSFTEKYRGRFGLAPTFVTEKKENSVFLLNANEEKDPAFSGIKIRRVGNYPPFLYFDPTYNARLDRGYSSPEDLMAGYKDPMLNEVLLAGVVKAHNSIARLHVIGTTGLGRNILALEITNFSSSHKKIPLLFSGAMHGNELTATEHCYQIIHEIIKNPGRYSEALEHLSLWIIPIVNPDGNYFFWHRSSVMGRKNAASESGQSAIAPLRGVDLNRNFPFRWNSGHKKASSEDPMNVYFRGRSPGSEKETQAMMQLAERERFVYALSFHAVSGKILVPYTIENVRNPTPDYAWALAKEIAPKIRHHNPRRGFRALKNIYPVDGTDQDYFYFKYGTLAYIIESSYRNCEYRYVPYYLEGYQPLWEGFMANYAENYKFNLKVVNQQGEPVQAKLRFSDVVFFEGEVRTTNPNDGTFFRLTKNTVPVEIIVTARGYETQKLELAPQGPGYPPPIQVVLVSR